MLRFTQLMGDKTLCLMFLPMTFQIVAPNIKLVGVPEPCWCDCVSIGTDTVILIEQESEGPICTFTAKGMMTVTLRIRLATRSMIWMMSVRRCLIFTSSVISKELQSALGRC